MDGVSKKGRGAALVCSCAVLCAVCGVWGGVREVGCVRWYVRCVSLTRSNTYVPSLFPLLFPLLLPLSFFLSPLSTGTDPARGWRSHEERVVRTFTGGRINEFPRSNVAPDAPWEGEEEERRGEKGREPTL